MTERPLARRRVVTTRDERGRLDSALARAGADVVHVPLIEIVPEIDTATVRSGAGLAGVDWLVVTSQHGASAVGALAAAAPEVRLAAVGTHTARRLAELAGRAVDVVPERQTAADLAVALPEGPSQVVVAQADRAEPTLVDELRARGHDVTVVTAYRTVVRSPTDAERAAALAADAVVFASGSAAAGWLAGIGTLTPPVVVAIGPTTARVATDVGLMITHVATDHSIDGLVDTVVTALTTGP